jgi:5'-nucleotidase
MSLNGQRIDPTNYRVTVNNDLAVGGDGFIAFKQGTAPLVLIRDVDASTPISRPTARSRPRQPTASCG